ncbi:MAG: hypothetical protein JXA58_07835 [Dehalococcoidia bacterium]|nr:hypothetical protein [Dehalococcoidia bacterium]
MSAGERGEEPSKTHDFRWMDLVILYYVLLNAQATDHIRLDHLVEEHRATVELPGRWLQESGAKSLAFLGILLVGIGQFVQMGLPTSIQTASAAHWFAYAASLVGLSGVCGTAASIIVVHRHQRKMRTVHEELDQSLAQLSRTIEATGDVIDGIRKDMRLFEKLDSELPSGLRDLATGVMRQESEKA